MSKPMYSAYPIKKRKVLPYLSDVDYSVPSDLAIDNTRKRIVKTEIWPSADVCPATTSTELGYLVGIEKVMCAGVDEGVKEYLTKKGNKMKVLIIIPARYNSTRLPGKPLADICGMPMVQHVYENARKVTDNVYVATDDQHIADVVNKFGLSVMTSKDHRCGTDRCYEAYLKIKTITRTSDKDYDWVINLQGDEPLINEWWLNSFIGKLQHLSAHVKVVTLACQIKNPNDKGVSVLFDHFGDAIYFSRAMLPASKENVIADNWMKQHCYFKHIGIYAFRPAALQMFFDSQPTEYELIEGLEQLRWIQQGLPMRIIALSGNVIAPVSVDTPEQLEMVRKNIRIKLKYHEPLQYD